MSRAFPGHRVLKAGVLEECRSRNFIKLAGSEEYKGAQNRVCGGQADQADLGATGLLGEHKLPPQCLFCHLSTFPRSYWATEIHSASSTRGVCGGEFSSRVSGSSPQELGGVFHSAHLEGGGMQERRQAGHLSSQGRHPVGSPSNCLPQLLLAPPSMPPTLYSRPSAWGMGLTWGRGFQVTMATHWPSSLPRIRNRIGRPSSWRETI